MGRDPRPATVVHRRLGQHRAFLVAGWARPARSELIYIHGIFFFVVDLGVFERFGPERLRLDMPKLHAVKDAGKPQKRLTVTEAAALNDHRAMLLALQDRVARAVAASSTNPMALAALARQLTLISKELSVLDAAAEDDPVGVAARTPDEDWFAV